MLKDCLCVVLLVEMQFVLVIELSSNGYGDDVLVLEVGIVDTEMEYRWDSKWILLDGCS